LKNTDVDISYLDFTGRKAYACQLFSFEDCFIAHNVGSFIVPKSLVELDQFHHSIITLWKWKESLIGNSNTISLAPLDENSRYALNDISNPIIRQPTLSPPRTPKPLNSIQKKIKALQDFFIALKRIEENEKCFRNRRITE
jgi:hypothetical protein